MNIQKFMGSLIAVLLFIMVATTCTTLASAAAPEAAITPNDLSGPTDLSGIQTITAIDPATGQQIQVIDPGSITATAAITGAAFEPDTVYQSTQAEFTLHVAYTGLTPGKAYYMTATLLDPATGLPYVLDNQQIQETAGVVPEGTDGTADIVFDQDISALAGTANLTPLITVLQEGGIKVCETTAATPMPTLHLISPVLSQTFLAANGTGRIPNNGISPLVQTITYHGLEPEVEYELKTTLCAGRVQMPIQKTDGATYVETQKFIPTAEDGQIVLTYKVDGTGLDGIAIVPAWELYKKGNLVAILRDATLEPKVAVEGTPQSATLPTDGQAVVPTPTPSPTPDPTPSPDPTETPDSEEEPDGSENPEETPEGEQTPPPQVSDAEAQQAQMMLIVLIAVCAGGIGLFVFMLIRRKRR